MEKKTLFVAVCNQKGGVGKSAITVLAASYLHYVKGVKTAVIDCDYAQYSIYNMRERDKESVQYSPYFHKKYDSMITRLGIEPYPVEKVMPEEAIQFACAEFLEKMNLTMFFFLIWPVL